MTSLPCLKNIDYNLTDPLWLFTDASGLGLGAALFQGKEWKTASPIAYKSHLMTPAERNYPVHEQELLAVIHVLQKWKMLLLGMKINVMSNHHSLTYLLKQRNLSRRQARWTEILADFDLNFEYVKGGENSVADALSRKRLARRPSPGWITGCGCRGSPGGILNYTLEGLARHHCDGLLGQPVLRFPPQSPPTAP